MRNDVPVATPAAPRTDPANDLLRAAARLNRWASRHAAFDIPFAQARLLALLDEHGPSRVSTLAEADHSSQPTITTGVQRLEAQGWASRRPDPSDARASLVALTDAGHAALTEVRRARAAVLSPVLDTLDGEERTRLDEAIAIVEEVLDRAGRAVPTRLSVPHRKEA